MNPSHGLVRRNEVTVVMRADHVEAGFEPLDCRKGEAGVVSRAAAGGHQCDVVAEDSKGLAGNAGLEERVSGSREMRFQETLEGKLILPAQYEEVTGRGIHGESKLLKFEPGGVTRSSWLLVVT
jgi:hypothetical protein